MAGEGNGEIEGWAEGKDDDSAGGRSQPRGKASALPDRSSAGGSEQKRRGEALQTLSLLSLRLSAHRPSQLCTRAYTYEPFDGPWGGCLASPSKVAAS